MMIVLQNAARLSVVSVLVLGTTLSPSSAVAEKAQTSGSCIQTNGGFAWDICDGVEPRRGQTGASGVPGVPGAQPGSGAAGMNVGPDVPVPGAGSTKPSLKDIFIPPAQRGLDGGGGNGR